MYTRIIVHDYARAERHGHGMKLLRGVEKVDDPEWLTPPTCVGASVVCTEQGRRARRGAADAGGCTRWRVESWHFNRQQLRPPCVRHTRLPSGVVSVLSGVVSVLSRRCAHTHTKRTRVKRDPHGAQTWAVRTQGERPRNTETRGERAHPTRELLPRWYSESLSRLAAAANFYYRCRYLLRPAPPA